MLGNPATYATIFPPGSTVLPTVNPTHNFIDTQATFYDNYPTVFIPQPNFEAYQDWYPEYPNECISKISQGVVSTVNYVRPASATTYAVESTYPTNIVYYYDPAPPVSDPVPDPNGTVGSFNGTTSGASLTKSLFPRWHTDSPYDMAGSSSYDYWQSGGYFPLKSHDYIIVPTGFANSGTKVFSCDLTVTNLESEVMNLDTAIYEYYDFTQTTFDYKQTAKVVIPIDWEVCCWNDGTVINGTVAFSSIDVTTVALGYYFSPGYGFTGMTATTGTTITAGGTSNFTVTISSGYTPVEITIPTVSGSISFISDFWITSVTAPS
jgi:hypothetical protein